MGRRRFTFSVVAPDVVSHLERQENMSDYLRRLVEDDMGLDPIVPGKNNDGVLAQILEEIRGLREDLGQVRIVPVAENASTRRIPAGLDKQVDRFREGKR